MKKQSDVNRYIIKNVYQSEAVVRLLMFRVFNRHGIEKDERSIAIERAEIETVQQDRDSRKKF